MNKRSPKDIAVFSQARKNSRRCKNKMLRPFSNSCLIDICLKKMNQIQAYPVFFGGAEEDFLEKARQYPNLKIIKRSQQSADTHSDAKRAFEVLKSIETPFVCWINPCHSFLKVETILGAIDTFLNSSFRSLTSVVHEKGWFYDHDKRPLTNRGLEVDTALADGIYRVAHAFHIYDRERMIQHGKVWDNNIDDPFLFEISQKEAIDIDTEEEFIMADALYNQVTKNGDSD